MPAKRSAVIAAGLFFLQSVSCSSFVPKIETNHDGNKAVEYTFNITVDHYSYREPTRTFPLRCFVNDEHWDLNNNKNGPVFFYAGNEAPITQFLRNSGFMFEIAPEFGAMVVFCEHRYYGTSIPDQDDFSFLTVEQALADFNTLTVQIREQWRMKDSTAFIAFGGSYGANLALWLRLKNPNLWAGAIASSATPLKHLLRETNGFTLIETEAYGNVSDVCPELVRAGWKDLYRLVDTAEGQQEIVRELGLCRASSSADLEMMMMMMNADDIHGWVSDALETLVQYGYPYPTDFYNPVPAYPFAVACHRMLKSGTGLGALRAAVDVFYNYTGQAGQCFDYATMVQGSNERHWGRMGAHDRLYRTNNNSRENNSALRSAQIGRRRELSIGEDEAWGYQTCTEVYQPMPTDGITDFEVPYTPNRTDYFHDCMDRYGVKPRPDWEEMMFMGANIGATGSNMFLTNGQLDPWRAAGIQWQPQFSTDDTITIRLIENGAHHLDLRSSHPLDPPSVVSVREEQKQAIKKWVVQWEANNLDEEGYR